LAAIRKATPLHNGLSFGKQDGPCSCALRILGSTGSVRSTLAEQYEEMDSILDTSHRLKTHNQYLATAVALGVSGVLVLLLAFLFPLFYERRWSDALFMAFLVIALAAMLVEDTLETQPGVTFVAFFMSLLLFTPGSEAVQTPE
jgi:hypothetical protein